MLRLPAETKAAVLGTAGGLFLECLSLPLRFIRHDGLTVERLTDPAPVIYAFWHGQQLLFPGAFRRFSKSRSRKGIFTLISAHTDGRIISRAIRRFGLQSVPGSSTRRGGQALLALIRKIEEGNDIAFTPDGPKGPVCVAKLGVIEAARKTGAPIIPVSCYADRFWRARSWDSMLIPKPWAKACCIIGEPMFIPENADDEALQFHATVLTQSLNAVTHEAIKTVHR